MPKTTPKRMVADCRTMPSEKNCSLTITGTEDEVLAVAVRHAVEDHGHEDSEELREKIRSLLAEEPGPAQRTVR